MSVHQKDAEFDVVVVGGGLSGMCAAIACARMGVKTAIVQNRSVFGGNASSEIRMHILGANCHQSKDNLRETGIIEEILLANKSRNPYASFPVFDSILWEKVRFQESLWMPPATARWALWLAAHTALAAKAAMNFRNPMPLRKRIPIPWATP